MEPNTFLPEGAKKLKPTLRLKIAGWVEQEFDAEVTRGGIRWLRVKDGLGGYKDREDWIADIPELCVAVHDYNWTDTGFGKNYGSFDKAIKGILEKTLSMADERYAEALKRVSRLKDAISDLGKALRFYHFNPVEK